MSSQRHIFVSIFQIFLIVGAAVSLLWLIPENSSNDLSPASTQKVNTEKRKTKQNKNNEPTVTLKKNINSKVWKGFTLAPVTGAEEILLLNMDGKIVHRWPFDAARARLLPNGNLLVLHATKWGQNKSPWSGLRQSVREYTWDAELVWEYKADDIVHHDAHRLANGNTLYLRRLTVPGELAPNAVPVKGDFLLRSDAIEEVSPSGEVVWSWHAHKHLDTASCGWKGCGKKFERKQIRGGLVDWTHGNAATVIPENKWYDQGDSRFKPGNILFLPRNWWTVFLIDKETGKVVWEYEGEHGGKAENGIIRGHEIYMIPKGHPGEGNLLLFDNGQENLRHYSIGREINPSTKKVVWEYRPGKEFFSKSAGSLQRLPNGNTFISQDQSGRLFEVDKDKNIVWEAEVNFATSRSKRYATDYCPQFSSLK